METSGLALTSAADAESIDLARGLIRVYLITPNSRLASPTATALSLQSRHRANNVRDALLGAGVLVYSPAHDDSWRGDGIPVGPRVPSAHRAMLSADVALAYLPSPMHPGVMLELGWASSMRKPIVLLLEPSSAPLHRNLIAELDTVTSVLPIQDDAGWGPQELRQAVSTMVDWGEMLQPPRS